MKNHKEEPALERERTSEFFEVSRALSDYVNGLNLDAGKHNALVRLMLDQVTEAEKGAFAQGFKLGVACKELEMEDEARLLDSGGGIPS